MSFIRLAAAASVLIAGLAVPASANAATAYVTHSLNMHTGPGARYPVIAVVPRGNPVEVIHCTYGYGWCEVVFDDEEGWVSGHYLRDDDYEMLSYYAPLIGIPLYRYYYYDNYDHRRKFKKRIKRRKNFNDRRRKKAKTIYRRERLLKKRKRRAANRVIKRDRKRTATVRRRENRTRNIIRRDKVRTPKTIRKRDRVVRRQFKARRKTEPRIIRRIEDPSQTGSIPARRSATSFRRAENPVRARSRTRFDGRYRN